MDHIYQHNQMAIANVDGIENEVFNVWFIDTPDTKPQNGHGHTIVECESGNIHHSGFVAQSIIMLAIQRHFLQLFLLSFSVYLPWRSLSLWHAMQIYIIKMWGNGFCTSWWNQCHSLSFALYVNLSQSRRKFIHFLVKIWYDKLKFEFESIQILNSNIMTPHTKPRINKT